MPNIIIQEKDETTVQEGTNILTDIVFIPGFADTNENVFVLTSPTATPEHPDGGTSSESLVGTPYTADDEKYGSNFSVQYHKEGNKIVSLPRYDIDETGKVTRISIGVEGGSMPQFAVNLITRQCWVYVQDNSILGSFVLGEGKLGENGENYWKEIVSPNMFDTLKPENEFALCSTVTEFKNKFGSLTPRFTSKQEYTSLISDIGTSSAVMEGDLMYLPGDYDKSYVIALECLRRGMSVLYYNVVERDVNTYTKSMDDASGYESISRNIEQIYNVLAGKDADGTEADSDQTIYALMKDRNQISVKYLSTGGYPTFEIDTDEYKACSEYMIDLAQTRGDCVFLVDHFRNPMRDPKNLIESVRGNPALTSEGAGEFATMFTPWAYYSTSDGTMKMPGSYAYLIALASSIQSNPSYLAIAGTSRGTLPTLTGLDTYKPLSHKIVNDEYQARDKVSINPITEITPYGWTIWGNRTLFDNTIRKNLVARSFLNIRNMVSDIKKQAYVVAKRLMFEQDGDALWLRFKMGITPLLDSMVTGNGLSSYRVIRATTKYDGTPLNKGEIAAIIRIFPKYAIEDWEITVVISDEEVSVE